MKEISQFDKECLKKAINIAKKTFNNGNYPVGAVLSINEEIIDTAGNEVKGQESLVNHAENTLIIRNGKKLREISDDQDKIITLYTTLEPCLQCLGASVVNCINRILFIEHDPNGGACNLNRDSIGLRYKEFWPKIIHCPISTEPKELMIKFFKEEIIRGNIEWPSKMLKLLR